MFKYKVLVTDDNKKLSIFFENTNPLEAKQEAINYAKLHTNKVNVKIFEIAFKRVPIKEEIISEKLIYDNSED